MKLPNQAQPILRNVSTAKVIGTKGIFQSDCHDCLVECRNRRGASRASRIICAGTCAATCALEGIGGVGIFNIFDRRDSGISL